MTVASTTLPAIAGFDVIELLCANPSTQVYRAEMLATKKKVVLKVLTDPESGLRGYSRLKHEFDLLNKCPSPLVVKAFSFEHFHSTPFLVLEDIGGLALKNLRPYGKITLEEKLRIAILISTGLSTLHHVGIIHKDINPGNIVYNPQTKDLRIIDFGIAQREANLLPSASGVLEGSLAYMAPEQTGRMNRSMDYRADLYALGVTLYEMFTGKLPFDFSDDLKTIHYHLAKYPTPPEEVAPDLPEQIAKIIMKLMAKAPEDRYQSALGLRKDLSLCLEALENLGGIIPAFPIGSDDVPLRFILPERLYGRSTEISALLRSFDKACDGQRQMVMISGYAGVGKSALVKELSRPVSERRGYFISGQYEPLKQGIPYHGLIGAFSHLAKQLMSESQARIEEWHLKLAMALGPNGRLLLEVFPDLEIFLKHCPEVAVTTSVEGQLNRFNLVFRQFIAACARPEHPLVLFLDNMQWIDASSLQLLRMVLAETRDSHLLFIGAYRDNELASGDALSAFIAELEPKDLEQIHLKPLGLSHLNAYISDALHCSEGASLPLTKAIIGKTRGNPFFAEQFLKALVNGADLWFDQQEGRWTWDEKKIQSYNITDNVVDLLNAKFTELGPESQEALKVAACFGHTFNHSSVLAISDCDHELIIQGFIEAAQAGLIRVDGESDGFAIEDLSPTSESIRFAFVHERFRQTSYGMLEESQRRHYHYRIAKLIDTKGQEGEGVFELVNQYNLSLDPQQPSLRLEGQDGLHIAELNIAAGQKALAASGYDSALGYLDLAIKLMAQEGWTQHYAINLKAHTLAAEAAYLASRFDTMTTYVEAVTSKARAELDRIPVLEVQVHGFVAQNKLKEAAALGKKTLAELGIPFPERIRSWHILWALASVRWQLRAFSLDRIVALPAMTDPKAVAKVHFQFSLAQCLYFTEPLILPLLICDALKSSLRHGNAAVSSYLYTCYGMLLSVIFKNYRQAALFGRLGTKVYALKKAARYESPLLVTYNVFVRHWIEHLSYTLNPLQRSFTAGLEMGDQEFATHGSMAYCYHSFFVSRPLALVAKDIAFYQKEIHSLNQKGGTYIFGLFRQLVHNLIENVSNPQELEGEYYRHRDMISQHQTQKDEAGLFAGHFIQGVLFFIYGKFSEAKAAFAAADPFAYSIEGTVHIAQFRFFQTLALLRTLPKETGLARWGAFLRILRNRSLFQFWAKQGPMNHQHRYHLIQAEWQRYFGRDAAAQKSYDQAAKHAKKNGYLMDLALSYELCGLYHLSRETYVVASAYLRKARTSYEKWGAMTKVMRLDALYPALVVSRKVPKTKSTTISHSSVSSTTIDLATLKRALIAIADEKVHSKMIEKIVSTALQFAGAGRGVLLLRKEQDGFFIEADGSVENAFPMIFQSQPLEDCPDLPHPIINFVKNTGKYVVLDDARVASDHFPGLGTDAYIKKSQAKSVLCIPLQVGAGPETKTIGILYLENCAASAVFTAQRIEVLEIICLAAAGRLELSLKAATDGLTGLYNYEYFQNILNKELLQSRRQLRNLSLVMVDIDHFKAFNDNHGHQVGDLVLKKVAKSIQTVCRRSDVVARYGGEEISIILPETDSARAQMVAERIRVAIESSLIQIDGQTLRVTASVGFSSLGGRIADSQTLIKVADKALYASKMQGRNRTTKGE